MEHKERYGKEKELTVDGVKIKVYRTEQYERIPVRDKSEFIERSLRTVDIGRPGYSKLIRGRLKTTGKWATATFLISLQVTEKTKNNLRRAAVDEIRRNRKTKEAA
ncbi:MAG: hypothetical protein ACFFDP_12375 [Promethearchaeota archaeon]